MDPWLESPTVFPDLHDRLIFVLSEALNARLPAPYFATIASRLVIEEPKRRIEPDVDIFHSPPDLNGGESSGGGGVATAVTAEVATEPVVVTITEDTWRQKYLEIHAVPGGERLVTVIEVLSPANKAPGAHNRGAYLTKQNEVLGKLVHLVEIDLLRRGEPTTAVPHDELVLRAGSFDYHVCVSPFDRPADYIVYPVLLPQRLPTIAVPLLPGVAPVLIDLQAVVGRCYDTGRYDRRIDYRQPPDPPLTPQQAEWVQSVLAARPNV
jgi:hypothetical protein